MVNKIFFVITYITPLVLSNENNREKVSEGIAVALEVFNDLVLSYQQCWDSSTYNEKFFSENAVRYLNAHSKTTVGFAPRITNNRKFFANLMNTIAFKEMLANDVKLLQSNIVEKLKYCDLAIMDQNYLKEFYDREIDPNKI